jgi:hypothetical protein
LIYDAKAFGRHVKWFKLKERYRSHANLACILFERGNYIKDELKPILAGLYDENTLKQKLFSSRSSHYLDSPLGKLERDYIQLLFK